MMKIGKPVPADRVPYRNRHEKYLPIYASLEKLQDGDWLPVECDSMRAAELLRIWVSSNRTLAARGRYQTTRSGNTLYIRRKPEGA